MNPKLISTLLFVFIAVLSSLVMRTYDIGQIRQTDNKTEVNKLFAMSGFAAGLIESSWSNGNISIDKIISNLQNHPDISSAFLTNHLAGILSPKSRALEIVDDKNIESLLNDSETSMISELENNEFNIYRRIYQNDEIKGVLVVNKILTPSSTRFFSLGYILRLIVLSVLAVCCSIFLNKVWVKPWQKLHEAFDRALQTGKPPELPQSKHQLFDAHRVLYSRYLMKLKSRKTKHSGNE